MQDEPSGRKQKRIRVGGRVSLLVDTPNGLLSTFGQIIDLSEGGCAIRLQRQVDSNLHGRVQIEVAGKTIWVPVITRWVRGDSRGWTAGCQFDRPTAEKQHAIRVLISERRRLTV